MGRLQFLENCLLAQPERKAELSHIDNSRHCDYQKPEHEHPQRHFEEALEPGILLLDGFRLIEDSLLLLIDHWVKFDKVSGFLGSVVSSALVDEVRVREHLDFVICDEDPHEGDRQSINEEDHRGNDDPRQSEGWKFQVVVIEGP